MDRRATAAISCVHFFVDLYSGFFPIYLVLAGLDPLMSALIASLSAFVANALQPFLGLWADRTKGRLPVFLGILGGAVCMSAIGLTRDYALLFVLVFCGKLGVSLFHPAGSSISAEAGRGRRELGFSVFTAIGTVGYSLSQPVFSVVTALAGFRGSVLIAIPGVMVAFAYLALFPVEMKGHGTGLSAARILDAFRRQSRGLGVLFAVMVFRQAFLLTVTFFVAKLYEEWGYPRGAYASASTIFLLAGAVSVFASGFLSHRVEPRRMLFLSTLCTVPFFIAFLVFGARGHLVLAGVFLGMTGLPANAGHVTNVIAGQRMAPQIASTVSGVLMGFAWAISNFGQPMVAALNGRLLLPGLMSGFAGLALLPVVAALCALLLPSRPHGAPVRRSGGP